VRHRLETGWEVIGIEEMRARSFGYEASTRHVTEELTSRYAEFEATDADIRGEHPCMTATSDGIDCACLQGGTGA